MPKPAPQYKPGQKAPASGQYPITGPRGGDTGKERTVTKGEALHLAISLSTPATSRGGRAGGGVVF